MNPPCLPLLFRLNQSYGFSLVKLCRRLYLLFGFNYFNRKKLKSYYLLLKIL